VRQEKPRHEGHKGHEGKPEQQLNRQGAKAAKKYKGIIKPLRRQKTGKQEYKKTAGQVPGHILFRFPWRSWRLGGYS